MNGYSCLIPVIGFALAACSSPAPEEEKPDRIEWAKDLLKQSREAALGVEWDSDVEIFKLIAIEFACVAEADEAFRTLDMITLKEPKYGQTVKNIRRSCYLDLAKELARWAGGPAAIQVIDKAPASYSSYREEVLGMAALSRAEQMDAKEALSILAMRRHKTDYDYDLWVAVALGRKDLVRKAMPATFERYFPYFVREKDLDEASALMCVKGGILHYIALLVWSGGKEQADLFLQKLAFKWPNKEIPDILSLLRGDIAKTVTALEECHPPSTNPKDIPALTAHKKANVDNARRLIREADTVSVDQKAYLLHSAAQSLLGRGDDD